MTDKTMAQSLIGLMIEEAPLRVRFLEQIREAHAAYQFATDRGEELIVDLLADNIADWYHLRTKDYREGSVAQILSRAVSYHVCWTELARATLDDFLAHSSFDALAETQVWPS